MTPDKILLLAYLAAVFTLNLFIYMIAEYYRKVVDRRLKPIGFIISMCAISVAFGAMFAGDGTVFVRIITAAMLTAAISSLLNGIELYFFTRDGGE